MTNYWHTLWNALCNTRREDTTRVVAELTAENEALKKHNEIMKESLAAAQAEVERLIQVTTREDERFRRRSQGAKDGWESRRAKQRKADDPDRMHDYPILD